MRVREAKSQWDDDAKEAIERQLDYAFDREGAAGKLAEAKAAVKSVNDALTNAIEDEIELPEPIVPSAEIDDEKEGRQAPLIWSKWGWAAGTDALKDRKAYVQ